MELGKKWDEMLDPGAYSIFLYQLAVNASTMLIYYSGSGSW